MCGRGGRGGGEGLHLVASRMQVLDLDAAPTHHLNAMILRRHHHNSAHHDIILRDLMLTNIIRFITLRTTHTHKHKYIQVHMSIHPPCPPLLPPDYPYVP